MLIRKEKFNYLINNLTTSTLNSDHKMNILISNEIERIITPLRRPYTIVLTAFEPSLFQSCGYHELIN